MKHALLSSSTIQDGGKRRGVIMGGTLRPPATVLSAAARRHPRCRRRAPPPPAAPRRSAKLASLGSAAAGAARSEHARRRGAVAPRARHVDLNVAKLGQQMAAVTAVTAIGGVIGRKLIEMAIDRPGHLLLDDRGDGLPAERTETLASIQAVGLHCLHEIPPVNS